ncbi:MAG: efflux RND transporter periplasmic adaptor subunit [Limnohabitans sp.]|jgi:HlyD family secretion protein|uniref:efflux RND transporter periplasmic adaptor subunit n=1 Tax=Limnohabitans sp. YIMB22184 TaxID=3374104 RepID=UPI003A8573B6
MNWARWNKRRWMVVLGTLALCVLMAWVAFRVGPLAPAKITVLEVQRDSLTPSVFGVGTVEARQSWLMGPTVAGRVLRVHADVGEFVKKGQLLAEMDPVDLDQRLLAQEAAVAKASSVQMAARAQLADAQARRALASTNLSRQKDLARQNFISQGALEGREQELTSAEAAVQTAQANVQAAAQDAQRLQAERSAAALLRQNSRLIAPADAVVLSRDAESGSTVVAGQPVLRLANPASLWVKMRVDQSRSEGLAMGLPARIVLRSQPQNPLSGQVERVEWLADAVTEERVAQVGFSQLPRGASIGEMAEVTLSLSPLTDALVVPQASVQQHLGRSGVWRVVEGQIGFVPVQWGMASLDGRVQALSGLQAGDTIVVYSEKPLKPGLHFQVVDVLVKKGHP